MLLLVIRLKKISRICSSVAGFTSWVPAWPPVELWLLLGIYIHCRNTLVSVLLVCVPGSPGVPVGLSSPTSWSCTLSASPWLICLLLFWPSFTLFCHLPFLCKLLKDKLSIFTTLQISSNVLSDNKLLVVKINLNAGHLMFQFRPLYISVLFSSVSFMLDLQFFCQCILHTKGALHFI